jgi:hypothetical protein
MKRNITGGYLGGILQKGNGQPHLLIRGSHSFALFFAFSITFGESAPLELGQWTDTVLLERISVSQQCS